MKCHIYFLLKKFVADRIECLLAIGARHVTEMQRLAESWPRDVTLSNLAVELWTM